MIQLSNGIGCETKTVELRDGPVDLVEMLDEAKEILAAGMEPMPMLATRKDSRLRIMVFDRPMCPAVGEAIWSTLHASEWDEFFLMRGVPKGTEELRFFVHRGPKSDWKPLSELEGYVSFVKGAAARDVVFDQVRWR